MNEVFENISSIDAPEFDQPLLQEARIVMVGKAGMHRIDSLLGT
jgi:hypothetical protein